MIVATDVPSVTTHTIVSAATVQHSETTVMLTMTATPMAATIPASRLLRLAEFLSLARASNSAVWQRLQHRSSGLLPM